MSSNESQAAAGKNPLEPKERKKAGLDRPGISKADIAGRFSDLLK
jgi:hypothetical protein